MTSQFLKTMPRSSARQAGCAAALVCALCTSEAGANEVTFDGLKHGPENRLDPVIDRQLPDDVLLAQYAGDCGCDHADDYDEDFADDFDEDYAEDFEEDHGDQHGAETASNQGITAEQQERLNRVLDRQVQVMEKTILWRDPFGPGYY